MEKQYLIHIVQNKGASAPLKKKRYDTQLICKNLQHCSEDIDHCPEIQICSGSQQHYKQNYRILI